jgi:hypothetical protein
VPFSEFSLAIAVGSSVPMEAVKKRKRMDSALDSSELTGGKRAFHLSRSGRSCARFLRERADLQFFHSLLNKWGKKAKPSGGCFGEPRRTTCDEDLADNRSS